MLAADELIIDLFSGGGGASKAIEEAFGRSPNYAVNHDPEALAMHEANHPGTIHLCGDVWDVNPRSVCGGRRVGLLWASPDCKHFSRAKGGQPNRSKKIRGLAHVVVRWAREVGPRVIALENVPEFEEWGPLDEDGRPDQERKGATFQQWLGRLKVAGYHVEWRELRACDYGAPTTRKRLFLIARNDGQPIVWPEATHGPGLLPFRTAANCIDWTIPVPSIFGRSRELADNTKRRIARGIGKFVEGSSRPFVIPVSHSGDVRVQSVDEPLRTVTSSSRSPFAFVAPTLIQTGYGERPGQAPRVLDLGAPLGTAVAGGVKHALGVAFLAKHYGGNETPGSSMERSFDTVTCTDHHALVTVELGKRRAEVRAFLDAHGLTGLVAVNGEQYEIADIGMRMLRPRELFRAQGFPDSYIIDPVYNGKPLTLTAQTRMCGNSVPPPPAAAILRANFAADKRIAA